LPNERQRVRARFDIIDDPRLAFFRRAHNQAERHGDGLAAFREIHMLDDPDGNVTRIPAPFPFLP
jgi:hypothetical protein